MQRTARQRTIHLMSVCHPSARCVDRFSGLAVADLVLVRSMTRAEKLRKLKALARKRQSCHWRGYKGIGDYHSGAYECDFVSPYTKTAGNVGSHIMVILQDWSSDAALSQPLNRDCVTYGYATNLYTNRNLERLLQEHFSASLRDIYATNLFPFVKRGQMGTTIPRSDLVRAAQDFALPQINTVRPKLAICLGLVTFNALCEACGHEPVYPIAAAIRAPFSLGPTRVWCQAHTGARGQNNRNSGRKRVPEDWKRMKKDLSRQT